MRNALLIALPVLALATVSIVGCGDASPSSGIQRRPNPNIPAGDHDPDDVGSDGKDEDPTNPNATTPPPAPTTPGQTSGQLGVKLSTDVPAADLGTTTDITVTVEPKAGFKGDAALTVTGLPTGATAAFSPASVTLNTTPVTSKLTITVPYTAVPSAQGAASAIVVKAAAGAIEATAPANFKVNPKVTLVIPMNADALRAAGGTRFVDTWGGPTFGTAPQPLSTKNGNGIVFVVKNNDSVGHIVHGNAGFTHGSTGTPIPAGGTDPTNRTLNPPAGGAINTSGYLHEGQNTTSMSFRITVNAAP